MLSIRLLERSDLKPYILLVRPDLRHRLLLDDDPNFLVLGASFWGQPVAVAVSWQSAESATLLDFYVLPSYRQAGIGTALLSSIEARLVQDGIPKFHTTYRPDEHTSVFERLLTSRSWAMPVHRSNVFWTTKELDIVSSSWVQRYRFRPPYELIAWSALTPDERSVIDERGATGWYPPSLSPFSRPDEDWDPETSVGLRYKGQVVGWVLTVREAPTQLLVETLFVDPPLQRLGRGFMMIGEVIRRSSRAGMETTYWRVEPDNEPMLRWSRRAFQGALADEYEEWYSEKKLIPKASAG